MKNKLDLVGMIEKRVLARLPINQAPPAQGAAWWYHRLHQHASHWAQALFGIFIVWLMFYVFSSMFLALLSLAFFVFIPGQGVERVNNIVFRVIMFLLLALAFINAPMLGIGLDVGQGFLPWQWDSTTIVFVAIWAIGLIAGWSTVENRHAIGVIIVIVSFVIFTMGVGTQTVGKAAFGSWWPTVYKFGSNIFGPLFDGLSSFFSTMGRGFELISNPVGVANKIASGNYVGDPTTGAKGALGLKIDRVDVSPIFPYQPFQVTVKLKNEGGVDAENVEVALEVGEEAPTGGIETSNIYKAIRKGESFQKFLTVKDLGFDNTTQKAGDPPGHFEKAHVDEVFFFTGGEGLTCGVMNNFGVRSQYIPIAATVKYDYKVESSLPLEVVSREEWARRAVEGLDDRQKKVAASLSNSPIKLNLDAPEQPIRYGRPIFVAMSLESAQKTGQIDFIKKIKLSYPEELVMTKCTLQPTSNTNNQIVWDGVKGINVIFCDFIIPKELAEPTQSFLIRAEAEFTYKSIKSAIATMEFGGGCCSDSECSSGFSCDWKDFIYKVGQGSAGKCLPKSAAGGYTGALDPRYLKVNMTYCKDKTRTAAVDADKCDIGEGQCTDKSQCFAAIIYSIKDPAKPGDSYENSPLACTKVNEMTDALGQTFKVCCPQGATSKQCLAAYKGFVDGKEGDQRNRDLIDAGK